MPPLMAAWPSSMKRWPGRTGPGRTPVGQRLRPASTKPWFTIIGVAKDVKQAGVDQPVGAEAYVLVDQFTTPPQSWVAISPTEMSIVARTELPLAVLAPSIGGVVRGINPSLPVARLREMDTVFDESIRRPRLLSQLLALFSTLALTLAAIGTYGVLASMVAERRRELGIRLALGADRGRLLRDVLRQGLSLAGAGDSGRGGGRAGAHARADVVALRGPAVGCHDLRGGDRRDPCHRGPGLMASGLARLTPRSENRAACGVVLRLAPLAEDGSAHRSFSHVRPAALREQTRRLREGANVGAFSGRSELVVRGR